MKCPCNGDGYCEWCATNGPDPDEEPADTQRMFDDGAW
jgi:hypothetical protein